MKYALLTLLRRRLLLPVLALGVLLVFPAFISGDMTKDSLKAKGYFDTGFAKAVNQKFETAESDLRESIRLYPDHAEAHYWLAFAIGNQSFKDMAISELGKSVLLKPGYAEGHYFIGLWYATRNQEAEVEGELREAIRLNPFYAEPLYVLAWLLDAHDRRKEARPFWERALKVEKDTASFRFVLKRLAEPD